MMRLAVLLVILFLPFAAYAQAPAQTGPQQVAAFLASSLTAAMAENDALKAQNADLQKQLDALKKPVETPPK